MLGFYSSQAKQMELQNPMSGDNKKEKVIFPLNFKIQIITGNGEEEDIEVEQLFKLRTLTEENKIPCKVRAFDSSNETDATLISKIPCVFIIGKKNEVSEVLYPDEKLVETVKGYLLRCKNNYEEKQRKQGEWNKRFSSITQVFWGKKKLVASSK